MRSSIAPKIERLNMDSFSGLNRGSTQFSPIEPCTSRADTRLQTTGRDLNVFSPFDQLEERQVFNGPSHDYAQYKQQVGLPLGSIHSMIMQPRMMDGFNSGTDLMEGGFSNGWYLGIDMDAEMSIDSNQPPQAATPPTMYFPSDGSSANSVESKALSSREEISVSTGRVWPGMHSQQAQQMATQKAAQTQAMQQRQMRMQAQQQQYRQAANIDKSESHGSYTQLQSHGNSNSERPSHGIEPHVEGIISRLLNQMRNNSSGSGNDAGPPERVFPRIARMGKEEEGMDEDERLLASEEGKKLSSKERRQLRNKVSARAFRSRRKEYISQLESEIALRNQEATDLRNENSRILQESERYRGLIQALLRHPNLAPFFDGVSVNTSAHDGSEIQQETDHSIPASQQAQQQQQAPVQPRPQPSQDVKPELIDFDASQLQIPQQQTHVAPRQQQQHQQQGTERVTPAMIMENDSSKLNMSGLHVMNSNYQSIDAFPIISTTMGIDPADLLATSSASTTFNSGSLDMDVLLKRLDQSARKIAI